MPLDEAGELPAEYERRDSILPLVMKLKPDYRVVLYMFYYEDMPVKQIAGILGEKPTAVTTRLARARQKLKQLLEKEGYDEY